MTLVIGWGARGANKPLAPFSFSRRELGAHDVLIEILYCGICHSDIHKVRDEWGGSLFPMVPGHEIVGIISAIGSKVKKYKVDDKVGVGCMVDSCRQCSSCQENLQQYCDEGATLTYGSITRDGLEITQGGYSSHIVVDENFILRLPENLPIAETAPLLCAGITLYSPLKHWQAGPGKEVAIVGLGGLGHMGVKLASAMGAEVSVLSHSTQKQEDALRLGASHFYLTNSSSSLSKLNNRFDLIINTVSAELDWNAYLRLLKRDGTMIVVGLPEHSISVNAFSLILGRHRLAGSVIGGIQETQEMLDFCSQHQISADIELIPVQQINEAFERVVNSDVRYRFVIDLKTLSL
jgi:uncharacterized zinc-type alcohol dehydrogenase-like protein